MNQLLDTAEADYCPAVEVLAGAAAVLAGAMAVPAAAGAMAAVEAGAMAAVEAGAGVAAVAAAGGVESAGADEESSLLPQALRDRTAASEAAQIRVRVIFIQTSPVSRVGRKFFTSDRV